MPTSNHVLIGWKLCLTPIQVRFFLNRKKAYIVILLISFLAACLASEPNKAFAETCNKSQVNQILEELNQSYSKPFRKTSDAINCSNAVPDYIMIFENSKEPVVRLYAASILEDMGVEAKAAVNSFVVRLNKTSEPDGEVRQRIAFALGEFEDSQPKVIDVLIEALKSDPDQGTRVAAAASLGKLKAQPPARVLPILLVELKASKNDNVSSEVAYAIAAYGIQSKPYLNQLSELVQSPDYSPDVRLEIAATIDSIARSMDDEITLKTIGIGGLWAHSIQLHETSKEFKSILKSLKTARLTSTDSYKNIERYKQLVDNRQRALITGTWFARFGGVVVIHGLFWLALIFAYPRSPMVQTAFFWNPRIRRILGFPYVTAALKWSPYFRRILFVPFQEALRSDAYLDLLNPHTYFADLAVKAEGWQESRPINQVIPHLKKQIVLQGESGSGKSVFLRHLLKQSSRIAVYLPAQRCDQGVIAAIQAKLHGQAQDAAFLRDLIYSGTIDIYIDGLNEVTPDTRASIKEFVEENFKGNIILTTQPLEWKPPGKVYNLQPLTMEQIGTFLHQQEPPIQNSPAENLAPAKTYSQACAAYLQTVQADLNSNLVPADEKIALQQSLANPMDLTIVAHLLAMQKQPNLLRLREQQYVTMAEDYQQIYLGRSFPLAAFAEMTYQLRLKSQAPIPETDFADELLCLERHKMLVRRQKNGAEGKPLNQWFFRHEKVADYFIAQAFLHSADNRQAQHFADSRFRGVYLLLATLLPEPQKMALRERLIQYAVKHNDHVLSDAFIQRVGSPQFVDSTQS